MCRSTCMCICYVCMYVMYVYNVCTYVCVCMYVCMHPPYSMAAIVLSVIKIYLRSHNTQKHGQHARATHPLTHPPRATHPPSDFSCPVPLCSFTSNSIKGIKIHQHHKHKEQAGETSTNQYTQSVLCPASDCHFRSTCAKGVKIHLRKTHLWSKADVDAVEL